MSADLKPLIDRLADTAQDCRALIREMHEQEQSLKATIREAKEAKAAVLAVISADLDGAVTDRLRELFSEYEGSVSRAAHDGYAKVMDQFDHLAEPLYKTLGLMDNLAIMERRRNLHKNVRCLKCGNEMREVTNLGDASVDLEPPEGAVSICSTCGHLAIFTGEGYQIREATPAETAHCLVDQRVRALMRSYGIRGPDAQA